MNKNGDAARQGTNKEAPAAAPVEPHPLKLALSLAGQTLSVSRTSKIDIYSRTSQLPPIKDSSTTPIKPPEKA
jgi:hypothetical protein